MKYIFMLFVFVGCKEAPHNWDSIKHGDLFTVNDDFYGQDLCGCISKRYIDYNYYITGDCIFNGGSIYKMRFKYDEITFVEVTEESLKKAICKVVPESGKCK